NATFSSVKSGSENTQERDERMKKIVAAMEAYHSQNGRYPAAAIYSKDGKPLLSWRVAILPYIGEEALDKQFKLDEPWDSLHNKKLIAQMPKWYKQATNYPVRKGKVADQVITGPGTVFDGPRGVSKDDIPDGIDQTIFLVEVPNDQGVYWTKPLDLEYKAT